MHEQKAEAPPNDNTQHKGKYHASEEWNFVGWIMGLSLAGLFYLWWSIIGNFGEHFNDPLFKYGCIPSLVLWAGASIFLICTIPFGRGWPTALWVAFLLMIFLGCAATVAYSGGSMPSFSADSRLKYVIPIAISVAAVLACISAGVSWYHAIHGDSSAKAPSNIEAAVPPSVPPNLYFKSGPTILPPIFGPAMYVVVSGPSENLSAHTVFAALYLHCTNRGDTPITLQGYSVESLCKSGKWETMPSLWYPDIGTLYAMTERFVGNKLSLGEGSFDSAANKKPIGAGEMIQGWIFTSGPKEAYTNKLQIRIADNLNHEWCYPIDLGYKDKVLDTNIQTVRINRDALGVTLANIPLQTRFFRPQLRQAIEARDLMFASAPQQRIEIKDALVSLGTNGQTIYIDKDGNMPPTDMFGVFRMRLLKNAAFIDAVITDGRNKAFVSDNQIVEFPDGWDWNQDYRAVEFVNEKGSPVLQVTSGSGSAMFSVLGTFAPIRGGTACIDARGIFTYPPPSTKMADLRPIFKYPADEFPGLRAEPMITGKSLSPPN